MALTKSYLDLLKYIQENRSIHLEKIKNKFNKNGSTIRRELETLNLYLDSSTPLTIKNGIVNCSMKYEQYLQFISSLSINDYFPDYKERNNLLTMKIFIYGYTNASRIYQELDLSLTTKKADMKKLHSSLSDLDLKLSTLHRKGLTIQGDELKFRILIIKILISLVEVSGDFIIEQRKANTPIEKLIFEMFLEQYDPIKITCQKLVQNFLKEYDNHLTYSSKKFLLLYTAISQIRKNKNSHNSSNELPLQPLNLYFFNDSYENKAFNHIIALLDFQIPLDLPENDELKSMCSRFIDQLQARTNTKLYSKETIQNEIYQYIYKSVFSIYYDFSFPDKMVRNTKEEFSDLFSEIMICIKEIEDYFHIKFDQDHIETLTLIMKKWINNNKLLGRNIKNIIIVTNTSFERISYFIDRLKELLEVRIVGIFNINEISELNSISYDWIFTFSDRIQDIMIKNHFQSVKVNFFLTDADIEKILSLGFSKKHYKLLASSFLNRLKSVNDEELESFLCKNYEDIFI